MQLFGMHAIFFDNLPNFCEKPPAPIGNVGLGIGYSPVLI